MRKGERIACGVIGGLAALGGVIGYFLMEGWTGAFVGSAVAVMVTVGGAAWFGRTPE